MVGYCKRLQSEASALATTIRDVAAEAGVATSTVSRVLNGRDDSWVSDDTRQRIRDTAERLGYRTNPFASALRSGRSPVIVFILGIRPDHAMTHKAWALHETVTGIGAEVMTTHSAGDKGTEKISELLRTIRPAAVTWLHPHLGRDGSSLIEELHSDGTPVLLIDCPAVPPQDLPCDALIVERETGARIATHHLIERGHQRIGVITSPASTRMTGYRAALDEAGITGRFEEVYEGTADAASGEQAGRRLLAHHPELTALFCHSDLVAIGAMKAAQELGYEIPERMAVVGFDDDPWTAFLPVPLTTLRHPIDQLRRHTEELLRARLGGDDGAFARIDLPPELVVREST